MGSEPPLLTFLLVVVSGWVHRRQWLIIESLQVEDRMLKDGFCGKRIRFADAETEWLAWKVKWSDAKFR